jgi:orotate phosphoribosyltransferase
LTGVPLVGAFAPRYLSGGSHPKEFRDIPPLEMIRRPDGPVLVVDDISTSGFHMEEALGRLRAEGLAAMGIVMVAGAVKAA